MNEEIIKKLIQLTPEQQALLELAENAIAALCRSGVGLFYDYEEYAVRAINCNSFIHTEIDDVRAEEEWKENGFVKIPYWKGKPMADYMCFMCTDDYLYGQVKPELLNHDRNLFNE